MADVLLVNAREDHALAGGIADSLERSGLTVARGDGGIESDAPCVLVVWSPASIRSPVLREIAGRAQNRGALIAASLGGVEAPLGFARPAPFDLAGWNGDPDDPLLDKLFFAVDRMVAASRLGGRRAAPPPSDDVTAKYKPIGRRADAPALGGEEAELAAQAMAWKRIEGSAEPTDFEDFLRRFGDAGPFGELARFRLDKLTAPTPFVPPEAIDPHQPGLRRAGPVLVPDPEPEPEPEPEAAPDWREGAYEWRDTPTFQPQEQRREDTEYLSATARVQRDNDRSRRRVPLDESRFTDEHADAPREGLPWRALLILLLIGAGGYAMFGMNNETPDAAPSALANAPRAAPLEAPSPDPVAALTPSAVPPLSAAPSAPSEQPAAAAPVISFQAPAADAAAEYATPTWIRQPTDAQIAAAYPAEARARGITGIVALDCAILTTGGLDCRVTNSSPEDFGFAGAAMATTSFYLAAPDAQGKRTRLTIRFAP